MAGERRLPGAAVDDEIVPLRLARNRLVDRDLQQTVGFRRAERRAQIGVILLAEAHEQRAGAGNAYAVAAFAEIMRERGEKAAPAAGLIHPHVTGGATGAVVDVI